MILNNVSSEVLRYMDSTEKILFALRALYREAGYAQYRMSKFEEYDLYSKNKDFLISDGVITFTDTDGKLMALKPDVTLSIIKNNKDLPDSVQKLCYDERVYRISKSTGRFREITQAGLECHGKIDAACVGEVLLLAAKSMELLGRNYVLQISHLGILSALVDRISDDAAVRDAILKCVGEKNLHEIDEICKAAGIPPEASAPLKRLSAVYGSVSDTLPEIRRLAEEAGVPEAADELAAAVRVFAGGAFADKIRLDFSVTANAGYYNGVVFKGFVDGVPESVLSGGQYDRLMRKMGRKSNAVGFAVYVDELSRLSYPAEV